MTKHADLPWEIAQQTVLAKHPEASCMYDSLLGYWIAFDRRELTMDIVGQSVEEAWIKAAILLEREGGE